MTLKLFYKNFLLLLFFLSLSASLVGQNIIEPKNFRGKAAFVIEPNYGFPKLDFYIYDYYVLEKLITIEKFTNRTINSQGNTTIENVNQNEMFTGYILIDFNTTNCFEFDSSLSLPKLLTVFPLKDKKKGQLFQEETDLNIKPDDLSLFTFEKDTVIVGRKYKLLKSRGPIEIGQGFKSDITFYLDPQLKIPFHPFSKYLDEKFKGIIVRRDNLYDEGKMVSIKFEFKDESEDIDFLQKYITLAKQDQEIKKNQN